MESLVMYIYGHSIGHTYRINSITELDDNEEQQRNNYTMMSDDDKPPNGKPPPDNVSKLTI